MLDAPRTAFVYVSWPQTRRRSSGTTRTLRLGIEMRKRSVERSWFILLLGIVFWALISSRIRSRSPNMRELTRTCPGAYYRLQTNHAGSDSQLTTGLLDGLLRSVDHIYIVSKDGCSGIHTNSHLAMTCIVGRAVDACAPTTFVGGTYGHGYKVTFSHAFALFLAEESNAERVCVMEIDVLIRKRHADESLQSDLDALLQKERWSFVRFGYRPYFFERTSRKECPSECLCTMDSRYSHFCRLRRSRCDLRSADFYFVHRSAFSRFRRQMLNLHLKNSRRIVDVVPLNSFSNQWLIVPQLAFQKTLDISVLDQLELSRHHYTKCVRPKSFANKDAFRSKLSANIFSRDDEYWQQMRADVRKT